MMVGGEPMPSTVTARPWPSRHSATPMLSEGFPTTIIVGAGIAGLACARRLHNAQRPFLVISENVAGRVQRSGDGVVNLGAYYVRGDYTHVNRYVQLGRRISTLTTRRHDADGSYTLWDRKLLLLLPQGARFVTKLLTVRRH